MTSSGTGGGGDGGGGGTSIDIATPLRGFQYKHGDRPLEGYTIQRAAGRGGFGEVYFAVSDGGREVAVKLVHTYEQIELRGISHCMNLKSPHLITIFDVKYGLDGRPWVIMEFVSGPSLRELLDAAPSGLGVSKAAFFLREIAKGLTYLHECGIVHRDLKPGNIFYENGYVKIGDYGLSKAIVPGHNSGQTITVGTVHYMAPEIGDGRYDKGIDIYALGALLYEMLTGQVPFFGASPTEVLIKHLNAQVDLASVEEPFAGVIRKAMAKNPSERYASVQEMVESVFGSEHVRNSVSHFSPESLTIVAGHVARRMPAGSNVAAAASSSSVTAQPPVADPWGRFGARVQRAVNTGVDAAMRPCRVLGRRWDLFGEPAEGAGDAPPAGTRGGGGVGAAVAVDPVSAPQRRALAFVAIGMAALGTGIAGNHGDVALSVIFSAAAIVAGTMGVLFGTRRIAPGLPDEPKFLRRLAVGGFAGLLAAMASLPIGLSNHRRFPDLGETWFAMLACVFFMDWRSRTTPTRSARLDVGRVVTAVIFGAIVGAIFDAQAALVAGIVAGIALAAEVASPWVGNGGRGVTAAARWPATPQPQQAFVPMAPERFVSSSIGANAVDVAAASPAGSPAISGVDPAVFAATMASVPGTQARAVSRGARVTWMVFFVALATLGLFLLGLLVFARPDREESAMMMGFSSLCVLLAGLCLRRSRMATKMGIWAYLFRPIIQTLCVGSIVMSAAFLTVGNVRVDDAPQAIFFIVFPLVVLFVVTFFVGTGGGMSQMAMGQFSSSHTGASPVRNEGAVVGGGDFVLLRLAGGAGRMVLSVVAAALLAAAAIVALGVAADVPGLFNSALVDDHVRYDMHRTFGNSDWPRMLRTLASIASFALAAGSMFVFMSVRRRAGVVHMSRALAAAGVLFLAITMLAPRLPAWGELTPTENGWELVDQYLRHVSSGQLVWTAVSFVLAALLLLWPAGRRQAAGRPAVTATATTVATGSQEDAR